MSREPYLPFQFPAISRFDFSFSPISLGLKEEGTGLTFYSCKAEYRKNCT